MPTSTGQYSYLGAFTQTGSVIVVTYGGYTETYSRETYSDLRTLQDVSTVTTTYHSTDSHGAVVILTGAVVVGEGGIWFLFGGFTGGGLGGLGGHPPVSHGFLVGGLENSLRMGLF